MFQLMPFKIRTTNSEHDIQEKRAGSYLENGVSTESVETPNRILLIHILKTIHIQTNLLFPDSASVRLRPSSHPSIHAPWATAAERDHVFLQEP
jgi:hypothetical protein